MTSCPICNVIQMKPLKQFVAVSRGRVFAASVVALASLAAGSQVCAQLTVPVGGITIDFDSTRSGVNNGAYNGSAPVAAPGPGGLNSGAFAFQLAPTFRGGTTAFGAPLGANSDGVYGFIGGQPGSLGTGQELGFVPANGGASTFGSFALTTVNGTGSAINQFTLQLDFNFNNQTSRGVTLNVSYTISGVTTGLGLLTFTPGNAQGTIAGTHLSSGLITLGAAVPIAGQIIFNFTLATNSSGAGSTRDEVGLDNIRLTEMFVPEPGTYAAGAMALVAVGFFLRRRFAL